MPSLKFLTNPDYLLPQVVSFLTDGWKGGLLDLSESILVLPTQEARRRLHEALVRKAATNDQALLPPSWSLPMQLLEGNRFDLAPDSLEQLLWMQIVTGMTSEESRRLFPRKIPKLDPAGTMEFSNSIRKLRGELSQVGITLHEAEAQKPEDPRWKALVSLESRYLKQIAPLGYKDRIAAQLEGAVHPRLSPQIRQLVIAGVPDLPKVYETFLPAVEVLGIMVTILSYDPLCLGARFHEGKGQFFDPLGRPDAGWAGMPISIEKNKIHLCLDRSEEAEKTARIAQASGGDATHCTVGIAATELARPVEDALRELHLPVYNPEGKALDTLPIGCLLHHLACQLRENNFSSLLQLLRHPDCQHWLGLDPVHDLESLDDLQRHLIPSDLDDLLHRWPEHPIPSITISEFLHPALILLQNSLSRVREGMGIAPLLEHLRAIYTSTDLARIKGGKESVERIQAWMQGGEELMLTMRSGEILALLLKHLQSCKFTGEKIAHAVELQGWLELLWEDAPHLIVAGMNDGLVPEVRQPDPFLSEKLRMAWGMACESSRLCRDSYLLICMIAARAEPHARFDLLLAQHDAEGSVLKPSRLLLRPPDADELPILVQELFRELPPRPSEQWQSAWALKPDRKDIPHTLSASSIKEYLACPVRFYLKQILKLKKESFGAEEADASVFGILLHETLRDFSTDPGLKNLRDEHQIEVALTSLWKKQFETRFGTDLSFPLLYQLEAGIRRLRGAANAQSILRAEGWEIIASERKFRNFPLSCMMLNGQIDRIDRRVVGDKTEWRILDYKSSEAGKTPEQQHLQPVRKHDDLSSFAAYECFEIDKKQCRWIDLQLPLYQMVLRSEMKAGNPSYLGLEKIAPGPIEVGYLNLPAKISETSFVPFTELNVLSASAEACLKGVLQSIHDGIFWPPRHPKHDAFEGLFFDHLESEARSGQQTLDPTNLIPHSCGEVSA